MWSIAAVGNSVGTNVYSISTAVDCVNDPTSNVVNRCLLLNARSLKNKLCDFNYLLSDDYLAVSVIESYG